MITLASAHRKFDKLLEVKEGEVNELVEFYNDINNQHTPAMKSLPHVRKSGKQVFHDPMMGRNRGKLGMIKSLDRLPSNMPSHSMKSPMKKIGKTSSNRGLPKGGLPKLNAR